MLESCNHQSSIYIEEIRIDQYIDLDPCCHMVWYLPTFSLRIREKSSSRDKFWLSHPSVILK